MGWIHKYNNFTLDINTEKEERKGKVNHAYRVEPHHPEDPDGEGKVDHQDGDEQQDKQVETALPPAIDADLVDVFGHRPRHAAALGSGDIFLPHHLLTGHDTPKRAHRQQKQMLKEKRIHHSSVQLSEIVHTTCHRVGGSLSGISENRP